MKEILNTCSLIFEKLLLYKDEQIFKIIESHKNL